MTIGTNKTKYQLTWSGYLNDDLWDAGWRWSVVSYRFPLPIIYKWTKE